MPAVAPITPSRCPKQTKLSTDIPNMRRIRSGGNAGEVPMSAGAEKPFVASGQAAATPGRAGRAAAISPPPEPTPTGAAPGRPASFWLEPIMKISTAAALALLLHGASGAAAQSVPDFAEDVKRVAEGDLQSWISDPVIIYAIREQNETYKGIRPGKIKFLDETWIAEVNESGGGPMIFDLLDRQASVIVRDRRELAKGVITEIILMDRYGLNVAISDPTSDFYQGDEAKYQETFLKGPGAVHVSEIELDASTQKYQTQVSMTVTDPENGEPIGAVTFGIDLEMLKAQRPSQ